MCCACHCSNTTGAGKIKKNWLPQRGKPGRQVNGTLFEYVMIFGKTVSAAEVVQSVRSTHSQLHALVFCNYFWCILVPVPVGSFRSKMLSGRHHDTFKRLQFLYMLPPRDLMESTTLEI